MFKHCKEYYLNNIASFVQIDFVDLSALGLRYRSLKLLVVEGGLNISACQPIMMARKEISNSISRHQLHGDSPAIEFSYNW